MSNAFQSQCNGYSVKALCFRDLNLGRDTTRTYDLNLQEGNIGAFMHIISVFFFKLPMLTSLMTVTAVSVPRYSMLSTMQLLNNKVAYYKVLTYTKHAMSS